jgi:thiamine kinase-like enzyme
LNIKQKHLKKLKIFKNERILSFKLLKNQGLCNKNYFIKTTKNNYILRYFLQNGQENINRKVEFYIQNKAFKKNIASKALYLEKNQKFMISRYVKGKHKERLNTKNIKKLASSIKKLHNIKLKKEINIYDFNLDIKLYKKNLINDKSKKIIKKTIKINEKINKLKKDIVLCHNDLNPKNILFNKNIIKFIDWEFAKYYDKFFDLAIVCVEYKFDKKQQNIFLKSYLKNLKNEDEEKLKLFKKLYKNLCLLWYENISLFSSLTITTKNS